MIIGIRLSFKVEIILEIRLCCYDIFLNSGILEDLDYWRVNDPGSTRRRYDLALLAIGGLRCC